jgi:WD40 repeat protein
MSIEDLVTRLVAAARAAFTQARELHPDESFYCYALYSDAFAAYILPTCCSEEGLRRVASRYAEEFGGTVAEKAEDLRWNPPDWPHHMLGEEHFAEVLGLLESRGDPWQRDDDGLDAEIDARFEACFRALTLLDAEGFFGQGAERDQVIVTVLQGDQSDRNRLENARRLNPPAAVTRLECYLDVSEPIGDPVTLGSKGADQITALAYAADARLLVACGSYGELFAWDLNDDRELLATTREASYRDATISADGQVLLVTDHQRLLRVELPGGARHDLGIKDARAIAVSPDGAIMAAARDGFVQARAVATGEQLWRLDRPASGLRFSSDGTLLALTGNVGVKGIALVDASDGSLRRDRELIRAAPRICSCLAWSCDDRILATADQKSGHIRLWHRRDTGFAAGRTLEPAATEASGPGEPADLAFSPDGTLLASAHRDGNLHIWQVGTGQHLQRLRGVQESMTAVVFTDDHHLAAAGRDIDAGPPVYLWTIPTR